MTERVVGPFSGHPLVDYGRAAITAFSGCAQPEDVSAENLHEFASFLVRYYDTALLKKSFTVLWTTNWPVNNSKLPKNASQKQRRDVGDPEVRRAALSANVDHGTSPSQCAFCARTPTEVLARDRVPLLTGREPVNFGARGAAGGLAVCSQCRSALMGLALAPMCSGKILAITADQPTDTIAIARESVKHLRLRATLVDADAEPRALKSPRSRVIDYLLELDDTAFPRGAITVYAFSNSGQGPSLDIHALTAGIPAFLQRARGLGTEHVWRAFRAYEIARQKDVPTEQIRYDALELLFQMPQRSATFVQKFFMPFARSLVRDSRDKSDNAKLQLWSLITLFAEDVLMIDRDRLTAIRSLGDTLADLGQFDASIPGRALRVDRYAVARALLLNSGRRWASHLGRPVMTFDSLALIFESADGPSASWRLAWDFALIRMLERISDKPQILEAVSSEDIEIPDEPADEDIA